MPNSTKKSVEPANSNETLELPNASDFVSHLPSLPVDVALETMRNYSKKVMANPDFWAFRESERCFAEFDLFHPERVPATYPVELINDLLRGL